MSFTPSRPVARATPLAFATVLALLAGTHDAPARGASGLDDQAEATAEACQRLAETWRRTGAAPAGIGIAGEVRPVVDLGAMGVMPGINNLGLLQAEFDAATWLSAPVLFLPPSPEGESYLRSGRLTLEAEGAVLCGYGARLAGTDANDLGLDITADGVGVYGLTLEAPADTLTDWPGHWDQSPGDEPPAKFPPGTDGGSFGTWANHVIVGGVQDIILRDVTMIGAMRGGVRLFGASNTLIEGACVYRSHSDGIHIVNGSEHVTVRNSRIIETGDDCISIVTYDRDEQPRTVSDILIEGNLCLGSRTRGLTVIGGEDVDITGNEVRDTLMAGILLYPSPSHNTYPVRNVSVAGNRLEGAGLQAKPCGNCGDIVVNDPGGMIANVTIGDNDITARPAGSDIRSGASCGVAGN